MNKSILIGYIRKSKAGGALKLSIDDEAFRNANRYESTDGRKFVQLIVNADKIGQILSGERDVTSVCQLVDNE